MNNRRLHKVATRPMATPQRGFSFFEVLIAALVLGVAVLGFAGLQVRAIGSTGEAALRSQAAMLAGELIERIRMIDTGGAGSLNRTAYEVATLWTNPLPALPWTIGNGTTGNSCIFTGATVNTAPTLGTNLCAEAQMVQADALEIRLLAAQLLPQGTVAVRACPSPVVPSTTTCVHVGWRGQDATLAPPAGCELGTLHPNCFSMQGFF